MRYAVLSDIHGNLEAFEAALKRLSAENIDAYISLGDIVGYGADPVACIKLLRSLKPEVSIAWNHDRGAVGSFPLDGFNELAREAALWTGKVLKGGEKEYLKSLPTVYRAADFVVTHGSLEEPEDFNYILNRADAVRSMELMDSALLFIGHSHVPCIYDFEITGKRIVNAGSVGQPRNWDPRANFVIYDSDTSVVEMVKVSYDVGKARKKIIDAGLPIFLGDRLLKGQ